MVPGMTERQCRVARMQQGEWLEDARPRSTFDSPALALNGDGFLPSPNDPWRGVAGTVRAIRHRLNMARVLEQAPKP